MAGKTGIEWVDHAFTPWFGKSTGFRPSSVAADPSNLALWFRLGVSSANKEI
jgi:hypothetical protein